MSSPSFPTSIWDGDSDNRDSDDGNRMAPDYRDYARCIAEVAAVQEKVGLGAIPGTAGSSVVAETDISGVYKTVLTLADLAIVCAEGGTKEFGSALVLTLPQGAVKILGCTLDLDLASADYVSSEEGDLALGEIAATDRALTGQDVTWLAASSVVFAGSPGAVTIQDQDDIVAIKDGTTTAEKVYLNIAMDQGGGTGTITVSGTITIIWANLGDY